MKGNYSLKEVKKLRILEHDYNAFVRWYEDGGHTTLDNPIRQSVLINTIEDMERARKEMEKYPEFFDKDKTKRLSAIIGGLELYIQSQRSCTETFEPIMVPQDEIR